VAERNADLPVYSILVPVYREAGMIPQMARALAALDYPADKLDIWLVVEEDDTATRAAVRAAGLRAIAVPAAAPRTKPKACNYALQFAGGEFVVVFDAEDRPEPDQLRKAVAAFRANPGVSCFQARLAIDQASAWVSRMFAVDYALWFRTLLPGLDCLRAPIPLGGTSNHFRTAALIEAGAWDPFNVTEDADLGVRLARLGHRVAILDSTTWEEAPRRLAIWLRQRTRWMKGYMQTLLVHTRSPSRLAGELRPGGLLLLLTFLGGAVWSSLVNPLLWIVCIGGALFSHQGAGVLEWLARVSGVTLLAANVLLAVLAMCQGGRRGGAGIAIVLTYPLYWLLISAAAYRALWQLLRDPFRWEKTPHGAALL
jgi:glycosyltransferase XagB